MGGTFFALCKMMKLLRNAVQRFQQMQHLYFASLMIATPFNTRSTLFNTIQPPIRSTFNNKQQFYYIFNK